LIIAHYSHIVADAASLHLLLNFGVGSLNIGDILFKPIIDELMFGLRCNEDAGVVELIRDLRPCVPIPDPLWQVHAGVEGEQHLRLLAMPVPNKWFLPNICQPLQAFSKR
jgi:hypothetical protein